MVERHRPHFPLAQVDAKVRGTGSPTLGAAAAAHIDNVYRRRRSCRSPSLAWVRGDPFRRPSIHGIERAFPRPVPLRAICRGPGYAGLVVLDVEGRRANILYEARTLAAGAQSRTGRGRGPARRSGGLGRMADPDPRRHGPSLSRSAARGDPHLHAHCRKYVRRCAIGHRQARPAFVTVANIKLHRRRCGHSRRQCPGAVGASNDAQQLQGARPGPGHQASRLEKLEGRAPFHAKLRDACFKAGAGASRLWRGEIAPLVGSPIPTWPPRPRAWPGRSRCRHGREVPELQGS